jgi:hypothetical protein
MTIIYTRPKKFKLLSWLLMKIEGTKFSHVAMVFESESLERTLVYHATTKGVNFMSWELFNEQNIVVDADYVGMSPEERKQALQFCVDNAGKPYGFAEVAGIAIKRVVKKLLNKDIKNPFDDGDKSYFCVEIVLRLMDILKWDHPNPSSVGLKETKAVIQEKIYGQD